MNQSQRLHGLDFLRALMMSLGVVFHSAQMYTQMDVLDYYWDPQRSLSMDIILVFINTFRMPVFFALSGFFTAMLYCRRGNKAMLTNRYHRIVLPFLVLLPALALVMSLLRILAYGLMETGQLKFFPILPNTELLLNNTHNLWFLYYLVFIVVSAGLIAHFIPQKLSAVFKQSTQALSLHSVYLWLPCILLMAAIGSLSPNGRISANVSFIPQLEVYAYFGLCFCIGWFLFSNIKQLDILAKRATRHLILGIVSLVAALACHKLSTDIHNSNNHEIWHALLSIFSACSVYSFICGFFGLFSKMFRSARPWVRYFSDSAYWVFVFHSVPMVILALPLYYAPLIAEVKFTIVCLGTSLICLWTYEHWVRRSWLGELLNGRRA